MAQPLLLPVQQRSNAREPGFTRIDHEFVREAREQFEQPAGGPG